jgi:hypothetical protein
VGSGTVVALVAEPAPYSMPPVDLFKTRLILLPANELRSPAADIVIRTVDQIPSERPPGVEYWLRPRLLSTPISWAHKPFAVWFKNAAVGSTVPSSP